MSLAVVFDLDGTLVDSLGGIASAANAFLANVGRPPLEEPDYAGFVGWGEGVFIDKIIAAAGLDAADKSSHLDRFLVHYEAVGKDAPLMPHAEFAIREIRETGLKTGICTNKPRVPLEPILAATPLGALMDAVVAGDDLDRRKPDPKPLVHVTKALGAKRCLYVGDTPVDAETATRAHMPFALYTEGIRTVPIDQIPHDFAFSDFRELPQISASL